jgi:hypothetical protein
MPFLLTLFGCAVLPQTTPTPPGPVEKPEDSDEADVEDDTAHTGVADSDTDPAVGSFDPFPETVGNISLQPIDSEISFYGSFYELPFKDPFNVTQAGTDLDDCWSFTYNASVPGPPQYDVGQVSVTVGPDDFSFKYGSPVLGSPGYEGVIALSPYGGTADVAVAGNGTVAAFNVTGITLPTAPLDLIAPAEFAQLDASSDVTVQWTPQGADYVLLTIIPPSVTNIYTVSSA